MAEEATEADARERLARLGRAMDASVGDVDVPSYVSPPSRTGSADGRWWLAAAAVAAVVALGAVVAAAAGPSPSGEPEGVAAPVDGVSGPADPVVDSSPDSEPLGTEPLITQPGAPGELPVPGGEPTEAVTFVGEQLEATLVEWNQLEDGTYWDASYRVEQGDGPHDLATFSSGMGPRDRPTGEEGVARFLPGGRVIEVPGVDDAFLRASDDGWALTMFVGQRGYVLTVGTAFGWDEDQVLATGKAILSGLADE